MEDVSVYIFLDQRRAVKNNKFPVKIGLVYNRRPYSVSIKISLTPEEYQKVRSDKPGKSWTETKAYIDSIEQKARKVVSEMSFFTLDRFKHLYNADKPKTQHLNQLFEAYIDELKKNEKHSSAESYTSALRAFSRFHKEKYYRSELQLLDIDVNWLNEFEKWWMRQKKSITTCGIYMRNLRCIFNLSIDQGLITKEFYPFGIRKYEIPEGRNIKKALTRKQIDLIREYEPTTDAERKARDLFLFSYLSFGMNMKDLSMLRFNQIDKSSITFIREKTKSTKRKSLNKINVPLNDELVQILDAYKIETSNPDDFVFGVVLESDSTLAKKKKIDQLTKTTNKYLSRIGRTLGFEVPLRTYVARHSAASVLSNEGAPHSLIKEQLGHSSLKTTENYIKSLDNGTASKWQGVL